MASLTTSSIVSGRGMDYLVPAIDDRTDKKLAWVNHVVDSGKQYLKAQKAHRHIQESRDAVMSVVREKVPKSLSRVTVNRPKRQIREIVSTLSNLRARFEYQTDNKEYYAQAQLLNDVAKGWWLDTFADRKIKEGLQYAATDGIGYLGLSWDREFWTSNRGEIVPHVYSADQVLPYQIGEDHNLQKAYAVTIVNQVPIAHAHALFREKAHKIKPDAGSAGALGRGGALSKFSSPVLKMFSGNGNKSVSAEPWPMVTLRYTYVMDSTVHRGDRPKQMGLAGSSWNYTVPARGGKVPDGYNPDGSMAYRSATDEDAMLFPLRRLIISTETEILYDGSNTYWHGKVPLTPLYFDKWPFEYLPFSLVNEVMAMNASNVTLLRAIDDANKARLRPPMMYDNRVISENAVKRMDPRKEGQTIGIDFSMGDQPIKPYLPQQFYDVPNQIHESIEKMESRSDYQIGVADFNALAQAKQVPSGDTMESLMMAIGPLVQDMTRGMEHSIRETGEQWKGMALQFYTKPRLLQRMGKDRAAMTDKVYDPLLMIPKYAPGEKEQFVKGKAMSSVYSQTERARKHIDSFYMYIEPNSMAKTEQMSKKLMYLQLFRSGFPIDPWTVADALEIENFGPDPEGANTIFERWNAWKDIQNEQAVEAAEMQQRIMMAGQMMMGAAGGGPPGPQTTGTNAPPPGVGEKGNASGNPGQAGPGRPPSGQKVPHLEAKGDGRPVISES